MSNIFILEDASYRIDWFKEFFNDCEIFYTKEVDEACRELRAKNYDIVFLDRDLSYVYLKGEEPELSGEDVARTMSEEQLASNSCIVIHSVNPDGAKNMRMDLESYHKNVNVIPFYNLTKMERSDFKGL